MEHDRELITAEMLDRMSPNQRAQAFNAQLITDLEQLPTHFRDEVVQNARRLSAETGRTAVRRAGGCLSTDRSLFAQAGPRLNLQ